MSKIKEFLNSVDDFVTNRFLMMGTNLDDQMKELIKDDLRFCFEGSSFSVSITTKSFPKPISLSFVHKIIGEILVPFVDRKPVLTDIRIAVEEAVSNIVDHSIGDKGNLLIYFRFTFYESKVQILIGDRGEKGKHFDLAKAGQYLSKEELEKSVKTSGRGMGVYLIKKIMDEVKYEVEPGEYNRITMIKNF